MATPAAFSRLQLAAALLEYDNDPSNPDAPFVSAHDSAIFAHLRRNQDPRSAGFGHARKSTDYLGVSVPSEAGSAGGRESVVQRHSRGSIDALRNPFGAADEEDEPQAEAAGEVDLASWGLDAFIEKDKRKGKGKAKAKSEILPNPHPVSTFRNAQSVVDEPRGRTGRAMSMGTLNDFGAGGAFLDAENDDGRPRSTADLEQLQSPQRPFQRRRASSHALIETLPVTPPLHSVPFPTGSVRSSSPAIGEDHMRPGSRASRLDLHGRSQSNASLGSKMMLANSGSEQAIRERTMSNGTMGTMASKNALADDNPFAVRPPSPSRSSRFDPKVRARTASVGSMGTRILIDNDLDAESRRDRPYSTVELLRPKVLVMPSPLQSTSSAPAPPAVRPRSGFQTSTDGPPLPPGARSVRRSSTNLANFDLAPVPIASNSFTPNPRASLTLSQLAFRNTLMVGGQRDIAYSDIERALPRAVEEGEQAKFDLPEEDEESLAPVSIPLPPAPPPTEIELRRPAGKLYGRSLIDNLEHRKAEMKQKARTFTGDERPSMMVRGQIRRSSTLIDPETLGRPVSQNAEALVSPEPRRALSRRNSANAKPLLDLGDLRPPGVGAAEREMSKNRSVFGVDTLWEREMSKLKEMEAAEAEERRRREEEEEQQRKKKTKISKSKRKDGGDTLPVDSTLSLEANAESRISAAPPVLPAIQKPILKRAPVADDESDSESESDVPEEGAVGTTDRAVDRWVTESSDEEDNAPRRTPGVGLRYPSKGKSPTLSTPQLHDEDSEEDLPLAAAAERAVKRATQLPSFGLLDDDDEDKPLVEVIHKAKMSLPSAGSLSNHRSAGGLDDDDDEQPLGLRASRLPFASQASLGLGGGDEDDDKPLAFHPEQQRRTQYQMLAQVQQQQQQQQQQQMMMQVQMQNSMFFHPAMMGSGFFAPPMVAPPMMMGPPAPAPSPPPAHDAAKFGRVDRWRRDVAVEGEP